MDAGGGAEGSGDLVFDVGLEGGEHRLTHIDGPRTCGHEWSQVCNAQMTHYVPKGGGGMGKGVGEGTERWGEYQSM